MFVLRVHSVDTEHPLTVDEGFFFTVSSIGKKQNPNPTICERRGIVYLYRSITQSSLPNPSNSKSTSLFVVAVPNYLSADDFFRFCEPHIDNVHKLLFIKNDAMEDRYSVLIDFEDQAKADTFYHYFNGRRFVPSEAEVCHILFLLSVEFTEVVEAARLAPISYVILPTCPICLERLDPDTSGIRSTICDHSFDCPCTSKWTYLSCQVCRLCQQQNETPVCSVCGTTENLWVCLICGFVGCGRYKEGHAVRHWQNTQHCYSLDLRTQQIWDYIGDKYVHRLNHSKADGKLADINSHFPSLEGDCGSCICSEDSGISGALYSSKVEAIDDEYNNLLATQWENQRKHYEIVIVEAKSRREQRVSEKVEEAVPSRVQDMLDKWEKSEQEINDIAAVNRSLIEGQEVLRQKFKEAEERERSSLASKDEQIRDLEEQIRDLRVYIEAQKKISKMSESDQVRGGTVLPVESKQSSPGKTKRQSKSGKRRG